MRYNKWQILVFLCCVTMVLSSCVRNYFDQQKYEEIVEEQSPVTVVDEDHDWQLNTTQILMVDVSGIEDVERIQVFTDNPAETDWATIVGEGYVSGKSVVSMSITYPNLQEVLYAAAIDDEDNYTVVPFDPSASDVVNFSHPVANKKKMPYKYQPHTYTYLYEEEFPDPGDYDYNDVVLRVSMEHSGKREVRINVELAAVGGVKQMAAAMRLVGFRFDDVESVKIVDDASFDVVGGVELPDQMRTFIKEKAPLLKGLNNEAVINLFADSHWATGDRINTDYGIVTRKRYNVSYEKNDTYGKFYPRELTYIVNFKENVDVNYLSQIALDPFILLDYNGGKWEIHTYNYNSAQVLFPHPEVDSKNLPWVLCIPSGTFYWPLHAVAIGYQAKSKRFTYGAYPYLNRSFGEWAADCEKCTDWYLYPDEDEVYK